jgi:hypothetical protein
MKLLGQKNIIGLEYVLNEKVKNRCYARLWLGNHFIGTLMDEIYIDSYLFDLINGISHCKKKELPTNFSFREVFFKLKKGLDQSGPYNTYKYIVRGGTFTDGFLIFAFEVDGTVHVIWRAYRTCTFSDVIEQGFGIFHYSISKNILIEYINNFKNELSNYI